MPPPPPVQPDPTPQMAVLQPFPGSEALCETCGYRLCRLDPQQSCPECGDPIARSDPALRTGLPWQHKMTLGAWIVTVWRLVVEPGVSFRTLIVGGSNRRARIFLASFVVGLSFGVYLAFQLHGMPQAWRWAVGVAVGISAATYVEAFGVAFFSTRKGWRVPVALAEQVACYASVGWVIAVATLIWLQILAENGVLANLLVDLWPQPWGPYGLAVDVVLTAAAVGLSILWFEMLVWFGVRRVRYANPSQYKPPTSRPKGAYE